MISLYIFLGFIFVGLAVCFIYKSELENYKDFLMILAVFWIMACLVNISYMEQIRPKNNENTQKIISKKLDIIEQNLSEIKKLLNVCCCWGDIASSFTYSYLVLDYFTIIHKNIYNKRRKNGKQCKYLIYIF